MRTVAAAIGLSDYDDTIMWTIYREIDDSAIAESRSDNTVQDLLSVFIDDGHNFVNYDDLRLAENDSCKTQ